MKNTTTLLALSYEEQRKMLIKSVSDAVDTWFTAQCQDPSAKLFLYYLPGQLSVAITAEAPGPDWVACSDTPVMCNMHKQQVHNYAMTLLYNAPVYPV